MFLQARVVELEGEITAMKTAVSDAEHHQIRVYQELSKVKQQCACDTLDQKCLHCSVHSVIVIDRSTNDVKSRKRGRSVK